jgi:serine/threonine protein phosphatase 1
MGKIFAIGDVHGCMDKLKVLIGAIRADQDNDTLLFIGDYIDRGKHGIEVVDYVLRLKNEYQNVICLMGNHENMLLRYLEGMDEDMYLENGGVATLDAYGISRRDAIRKRKEKVYADHMRFFTTLKLYHETESYIFVHAGLMPSVPLKQQTTHDLLWIRNQFIEAEDDFGKIVVFGHTPLQDPLIMANKIGIDTGAVYGRKLTCVELPTVKIYQV